MYIVLSVIVVLAAIAIYLLFKDDRVEVTELGGEEE